LNVIPRDQHCISRKNISVSALKVMSRLRDHDFQAFLVGGAVRDLLLGGHPKDFDIATDATPEEVHALFRNSRIIGRRFRIVHVRFGREIIEVTTFRGHHDDGDSGGTHARRSSKGLLLRDNVFGSLEEDAWRRDLTVNALYYTTEDFAVLDHVDGLSDLEAGLVRIIGDPEQRYREDPVRMLRVVRFAAKLDFKVEHRTASAIATCAALLREVPPARLFDEFLKLFLAGYAHKTLRLLREYRLLELLFPVTAHPVYREPVATALLDAAMANTDTRIREDKPVTPAFILAAILWPDVKRQADQLRDHGEPPMVAMHNAAQSVISDTVATVAIPRRFSQPMREIWEFQLRLERRQGKKAAELVEHRRFRAAYDFLLLREQAGEDCGGLGQFWTEMQELSPGDRLQETGNREERPRRRGGRRRRRAS
jgi:poly(A) polymerase